MTNYFECSVSNCVTFDANQLGEFLAWVERLNNNLETPERFPLAGKIPLWVDGDFRLASSGYWQVGERFIYLAGTPTRGAINVPTLRMRALILITCIEYVARHTDCVDDATIERIHKNEAKLLSFLPAREIPSRAEGLYRVCEKGCDPCLVDAIVVSKAGEIVAVRDASRKWRTLAGDVLEELPPGAIVVNWEA